MVFHAAFWTVIAYAGFALFSQWAEGWSARAFVDTLVRDVRTLARRLKYGTEAEEEGGGKEEGRRA